MPPLISKIGRLSMKRFLDILPKHSPASIQIPSPDTVKATSSSIKLSSPPQASLSSKKRQPKQLYLDLGQKDFNARTKCKTCGMVYTLHDAEDDASHFKFCQNTRLGPKISHIHHLHKVWTSEDEKSMIVTFKWNELQANHSIKWKAFHEVIERMYSTLASSSSDSNDENIHSVLFFIRESHVQGCLMVERVHSSLVYPIDKSSLDNPLPPSTTSSIPSSSYKMGVRFIWVNEFARRRRTASLLVDAARMTFLLTAVGKADVAFSQPTSDGLKFAFAYAEKDRILVYK